MLLALLRLWWVVKGDSAKQAATFYYPVDESASPSLALKSHKNSKSGLLVKI